MVKATLISIIITGLFIVIYVLDLFAILSLDIVLYIAILLVVLMLVVAGIILGNPLIRDKNDDKNDK